MREAGIVVAQVRPGSSDREVFARAAAEERGVVPCDLDFGRLVLQPDAPRPLGMILWRDDTSDPEAPARLLLERLEGGDVRFEHRSSVVRSRRLRQRALLPRR